MPQTTFGVDDKIGPAKLPNRLFEADMLDATPRNDRAAPSPSGFEDGVDLFQRDADA